MSVERRVLEGVDRYRVMEAMFEGLRVVLSYRGQPYSPAYVQGISGAAFVVAGPCPCAPTCGHSTDPASLARAFGYEADEVPLHGDDLDAEALLPDVVERIKSEIRAGRPVLVWNAFTVAEWDVVCGFDDRDATFFGRGSYAGRDEYASADQGRLLAGRDVAPALGVVFIGERTGRFEAGAAELAALKGGVEHAHTPEDRLPESACRSGEVGDWRFRKGLGCYEWWIGALRGEPPRLPSCGERYCLGVYRSTRRAAADFCLEMAAAHPGAEEALKGAAEQFATEAAALDRCACLLFPDWRLPEQADRATNQKAAGLLSQAREAYARGIDRLAAAVAALS